MELALYWRSKVPEPVRPFNSIPVSQRATDWCIGSSPSTQAYKSPFFHCQSFIVGFRARCGFMPEIRPAYGPAKRRRGTRVPAGLSGVGDDSRTGQPESPRVDRFNPHSPDANADIAPPATAGCRPRAVRTPGVPVYGAGSVRAILDASPGAGRSPSGPGSRAAHQDLTKAASRPGRASVPIARWGAARIPPRCSAPCPTPETACAGCVAVIRDPMRSAASSARRPRPTVLTGLLPTCIVSLTSTSPATSRVRPGARQSPRHDP